MGKYFFQDREVGEPDAANRWFAYAKDHEIDISRAISIWEDALSRDGEESRRALGDAGIRVNLVAKR